MDSEEALKKSEYFWIINLFRKIPEIYMEKKIPISMTKQEKYKNSIKITLWLIYHVSLSKRVL